MQMKKAHRSCFLHIYAPHYKLVIKSDRPFAVVICIKIKNMNTATTTQLATMPFYKENNIWYADLPEFLERGLGTKANLMMVDGADTFLDFLSQDGNSVTVAISTNEFAGHDAVLRKEAIGLNQDLLHSIGHAPVTYGAYYQVSHFQNNVFVHRLWLCPVTEYVFNGSYPDQIYIKVIQ